MGFIKLLNFCENIFDVMHFLHWYNCFHLICRDFKYIDNEYYINLIVRWYGTVVWLFSYIYFVFLFHIHSYFHHARLYLFNILFKSKSFSLFLVHLFDNFSLFLGNHCCFPGFHIIKSILLILSIKFIQNF